MKITSKRKFKKILKFIINSFPFDNPDNYYFYHNEEFKIKSYKGFKVVKDKRCPKNTIYLTPIINNYENN